MTAKIKKLKNPAESLKKIATWRGQMEGYVLERETEILCAAVALIAKEHCVYVGLPGIAKSEIANEIRRAIDGTSFEIQLNRFITPPEILGGLDVMEMKNGRYVRRSNGYLPTAQIAILDEAFNANGETLKALQSILNERRYSEEGRWVDVPLIFALCTSNVLPEGKDLDALDDRLLMRVESLPLRSKDNWLKVVKRQLVKPTATFDTDDIEICHGEAMKLDFSSDLDDALFAIRQALYSDEVGVYCSDRKWGKALKAMKAYAYLLGDKQVNTTHLTILEHILWRKPEQRVAIRETLNKHVAKWLADIRRANQAIDEIEAKQSKWMSEASNIAEMQSKMGMVSQQLIELNTNVLVPIENMPEAQSTVRAIRDRMNELQARGRKAGEVLGF